MRGGYETTGNYDAFCGIIARWNFGLNERTLLDRIGVEEIDCAGIDAVADIRVRLAPVAEGNLRPVKRK